VITGVALGLSLLGTVVGVPILLGTLLGARFDAALERRLIALLMGVNLATPQSLGALKTGMKAFTRGAG